MSKLTKADNSALIILILVSIIATKDGIVDGLRMKQPAITSSSDILMVGVPARLTCNYIKYQSEKVREITWYAGYNGMSRKGQRQIWASGGLAIFCDNFSGLERIET